MIKLMLVIRSLEIGGAERQLVELAKGIDKSRFEVTVATFYPQGEFSQELKEKGIQLFSMHKKGRWDIIIPLLRLIRKIHSTKAPIIYGFLDVGNLFALIAGKIIGAKIIFGLRSSGLDFSQYDWTARFLHRLAAFGGRFADKIIANSFSGRRSYRNWVSLK